MLLLQPAVECVRMKVPEVMTPACVTAQMASVETTVKVSPYVYIEYSREVYNQYIYTSIHINIYIYIKLTGQLGDI